MFFNKKKPETAVPVQQPLIETTHTQAQPVPQPPAAEPDARFASICRDINKKCLEIGEVIFKACEAGDYKLAAAKLEEGKSLNQLFMMSMKHGMEIAERAKKEATEKLLKN